MEEEKKIHKPKKRKWKRFIIAIIILIVTAEVLVRYFNSFQNTSRYLGFFERLGLASTYVFNEDQAPKMSTIDEFIYLKNAWRTGEKIYDNPKIQIGLKYPSYFEDQELDVRQANMLWEEKHRGDISVRQPLYRSKFFAQLFTPVKAEVEGVSDVEICENRMSVLVQRYENSDDLSLYGYIQLLANDHVTDGAIPDADFYLNGVSETNTPQKGSFFYEGERGRNPVKELYFEHEGDIYSMYLIGGCKQGDSYSADAERVFDQILETVILL